MGKVYIYITRKSYGEQLARFITGRHNPDLTVELLTEIKDVEAFDRQDYLLTDYRETANMPECHVVKMVRTPEEAGVQAIFMYQSKEKVYQEILRITGTDQKEKREKRVRGDTKLIAVLSPEGGDTGTVLALETARQLAETEKVLYISLCGFPIFSCQEFLPEGKVTYGLSEIMLSAGGTLFADKLKELAFPLEQIWMLVPVKHYKDLLDFSPDDVKNFIEGIKKQREFGAVVLEMGQMFEYTFDLLANADPVYVPKESGFFAAVKRHVLQQYCILERQEALWDRIQFEEVKHRLPENEEAVRRLLSGENGVSEGEKQRG